MAKIYLAKESSVQAIQGQLDEIKNNISVSSSQEDTQNISLILNKVTQIQEAVSNISIVGSNSGDNTSIGENLIKEDNDGFYIIVNDET